MYHDVQNVQGKQIHKKSYLISKNNHYHEAIAYLEQYNSMTQRCDLE